MITACNEDVEPNPSDPSITRAQAFYEANDCAGIIAVGGGSAIDTAKAMGALLANGGKISDYYGADTVEKPIPPFITVPTTAGTGSEVTRASIITDIERGTKSSIHSDALYADVAVVDSSLLATLPKFFAAGALMDALTHAVESLGSPRANPLDAGALLPGGRPHRPERTTLRRRPCRRRTPPDPLALAACLAGASFTNTGLGIVHGLTHPVFNFFGGHHGTTNGILLAPVMRFNLPAMPAIPTPGWPRCWRTPRREWTTRHDAELAVERVRALADDIEIPESLAAIGAETWNTSDRMAHEAAASSTVATNPVPADAEDMKRIYLELM